MRSIRSAAASARSPVTLRRRAVDRTTRSTRIASTALERLDGAHEHGGGRAVRFGHHVEAVVHPVDKVHVGPAGRPEHDRVPGGPAEAGMRGTVVAADVGLDFDDPPDAAAGGVVADEAGADQRPGGVGRWSREEGPVDDAQADGYIASMRSGMNSPVSRKKNGITRLAEDLDDLRRVECAPDLAQERQFVGIGRDARDQEERVEDDQDRAEDQRGLDEAEEAADDLVREASLLEERLGLVEALDDEGERDRTRRRRPSRTRPCSRTRA